MCMAKMLATLISKFESEAIALALLPNQILSLTQSIVWYDVVLTNESFPVDNTENKHFNVVNPNSVTIYKCANALCVLLESD